MRQRFLAVDGARFALLEDGPAGGPLAVVVHGFPDSPFSWRHLLTALAGAGFHAVAPFQRGYAPTDAPSEDRIPAGRLALDVVGLLEALDGRDAVLVGHDWGAPAVYGAAALAPERVRAVVGMSVPPGLRLSALASYEQAKRSFYVWLFQLPAAEYVVAADDLAFLDRLWADWSQPGTDTAAARAAAKGCLADPPRLHAALGYYRALLAPDPALVREQKASATVPDQPFLYLHGEADACIGVELAANVPGRRVVRDANHFLQLDRPDVVVREVLAFVGEPPPRRGRAAGQ